MTSKLKLVPLPPMRQPKDGWGGKALGRWFEVEGPTQVGGICCRCYNERPAADLRHRVGAFNRWQGWVCSDCDPEPRQGKSTRPVLKRRPKW